MSLSEADPMHPAVSGEAAPIRAAKTEIRVLGLQRSGNHAVINWVLRQVRGPRLFFNDVEPEDPLACSRLAQSESVVSDDGVYELILYSYEDQVIDTIANRAYYPQNSLLRTHSVGRRVDLLVLRDPYNTFASRMQHPTIRAGTATYLTGLTGPQLWLTYAQEALGIGTKLTGERVVANYNRWCASRGYRADLAARLGLSFTDKGFSEVSSFGQGSSFDKLSYSRRAQQMNTDARWKGLAKVGAYRGLFRDELVLDAAAELFELDQALSDFVEQDLRPHCRRRTAWARWLATLTVPPLVTAIRRSKLLRAAYSVTGRPARKWLLRHSRGK